MRTAMLFPVIFAATVATAPAVLAKNYFKWTDDDGVTHYSARKPHGRDAEVVSVTTGRVDTLVSEPAQNSKPATKAPSSTAKANKLKDPERCENARANLEVLRTSPKVRMQDENGEIRYLSEEEKDQKSEEFQKAVEESC